MKPVRIEQALSAAEQYVAEQAQQRADLALKRAKLLDICVDYQNYLGQKLMDIMSGSVKDGDRDNKKRSFKYKQIERKFDEINKLTQILNSHSRDDAKQLNLFIDQFKVSKPILAQHRDPSDVRFLKSVGVILAGILSLGLIYLAGRSAHGDLPGASRSGFGSANFSFWKSEGQKAGEKMEHILAGDNEPAINAI